MHHDGPSAAVPLALLMFGLLTRRAIELPSLSIAIYPISILPGKGQDLRLLAACVGGQFFLRTGRHSVGIGIVFDADYICHGILCLLFQGFGPVIAYPDELLVERQFPGRTTVGPSLFLRTGRHSVGIGIVFDADYICHGILCLLFQGFGPVIAYPDELLVERQLSIRAFVCPGFFLRTYPVAI